MTKQRNALNWEKAIGGGPSEILVPSRTGGVSVRLQKLALSKLLDVELISLEVDSATRVYAPIVWVLRHSSAGIVFHALYASESMLGDSLPQFLMRTGRWDAGDRKRFSEAVDRRRYLLDEQQTTVEIRPIRSDMHPRMKLLILKIDALVKSGCPIRRRKIPREFDGTVRVWMVNKCGTLDFEYYGDVCECPKVEPWIESFCELLESVPSTAEGEMPGRLVYSFRRSVFEEIELLAPEVSRPAHDSKDDQTEIGDRLT